DRLAVWTERLGRPESSRLTFIAEDAGGLVGFAHIVLDEDPTWGALLDNLHVAHVMKRRGVGTRLMDATARAVIEGRPCSGLYLWVLEQNDAAQAFYEARRGLRSGWGLVPAPGGDPTRLTVTPGWRPCPRPCEPLSASGASRSVVPSSPAGRPRGWLRSGTIEASNWS